MPTLAEESNIGSASAAQLRIISCAELQNEDPRALKDILLAATEDGIFHLDFGGSGKMDLSRTIKDVEKLSRAIFDMPVEEKLLFDVDAMGKLKRNGYVLQTPQQISTLHFYSTLTSSLFLDGSVISQLVGTKAASRANETASKATL